jgi:hypothetical protein
LAAAHRKVNPKDLMHLLPLVVELEFEILRDLRDFQQMLKIGLLCLQLHEHIGASVVVLVQSLLPLLDASQRLGLVLL